MRLKFKETRKMTKTYTVKVTGQGFHVENVKRHLAMQTDGVASEIEVARLCKQMKAEGGSYGEPIYVTVPERVATSLKARGFEVSENE
jgi:hypothetical protein